MTRFPAWLLALVLAAGMGRAGEPVQRFFVSPAGRDSWSGHLSAPSADGTDGPFATLGRARDAVRALKREGGGAGPVSVQLRGGAYYLEGPVVFGPEDSGTAQAPVSYEAYPGERPELIGGRRLTGFQAPPPGKPLQIDLPRLPGAGWRFRSLFVAGRREVRARYPNLDPADPIRRGFLFAAAQPGYVAFGVTVGGIHGAGDWLEYRLTVPAAGDYALWLHYGAANAPYGFSAMDGRCAVSVDGRAPVALADLEDTGAWKPVRWGRAATFHLSAGEHRLRWQNRKGGGLVLDALALCDDPRWRPSGADLPPPAQGRLVTLSAKDFLLARAPQMVVSGAGGGPKDALWCAPGEWHPAWSTAPDAEVHIFPSGECRAFSEILSIQGHDRATGRVALGGPETLAALNPGDRFFIENIREELDAPGEWHVDAQTGRLTYLPRPGFSARTEVIVPLTRRLLQVEGRHAPQGSVRHLRFAGLVLRDTDWARGGASAGYGVGEDAAIVLRGAEACVVEDCRFLNLGGYAVALDQGRGHVVQNCEVAHAGGGGVLVRDSAGNRITDNHLHHLGEAYAHVGGVVLASGAAENQVAHNAIHDSARYGISLKNAGGRNVIEYNLIQNTCLETSDAGGIEVTQHDRAVRSGSWIRFNRVADTIGYTSSFGEPSFLAWGIYLDSFASGYEVRGNVVCRAWNGGIMLQGGRGNRVVNNVFVDGQVAQGTLANFEGQARDLQLMSNVIAYSAPGATTFVTGTLGPEVIQVDRNLYFPPLGAPPRFGAGGGQSLAEWRQAGRDRGSKVGDPLFQNPRGDDYTLRPGSPAYLLGFQALPPPRLWGPRRRPCTCAILPAGPRFWGKGGERPVRQTRPGE
ncbi:right-handed parallel beta-helix repeat-containing protein [Geothrix edaphica]|uniref:CBM6 domain-containing protein n=1 Tax=Geothrix edaphica TaxID=2927976 RepID=A0ABQ5PW38_9BACT|nr:right-handed parallel beta-helix repeat-containing protein [Geothrix edaphica]GLH66281.1 hypothetical protein GETHED_06450 [Geothrix edaphica]